jgi:hypothetical protein
VTLAIVAGAGVALVGILQGSSEDVANGLIAFHTAGAARTGLDRRLRIAGIGLGIVGMLERAAIYTIMVGHVLLGSSLAGARQAAGGGVNPSASRSNNACDAEPAAAFGTVSVIVQNVRA